jgi:FSR family fosmidomycin resistance protein-like MFS transporter
LKTNGNSIWMTFGVLAAGHFLVDLYVNILPPVMPEISIRLGLSMALNGLLFTFLSVTTSWLQPFIGFVCDRLKSRWLLPISLVWLGVLMCSIGWLDSYWLLTLVAALAGIGSAVYHPVGSVAIGSLNLRNKGFMMSLYIVAGTLGMTVAPIVAVAVSEVLSLKGLILLALPSIISAMLLLKFIRSDARDDTSVISRPVKFKILDLKPVMLILAIMALREWTLKSFIVFIPHYYVGLGYTDGAAAFILSAYLFAQSLGGVLGGFLGDKVGNHKVILYSGFIGLAFNLAYFVVSGPLAILLLCLAGAALYGAFPVTVLMAQDMVPNHKNLASGLMCGLAFGMGGMGSLVTGAISDYLGGNMHTALATTSIAAAVSTILGIYLVKSAKSAGQKITA